MPLPLRRAAAALAAVLAAAPLAAPAFAAPGALDAAAQARALGRGVNALGFDPLWDDLAKAKFQRRHFHALRQTGFSTVRVNLFTFRHLDAQGRLDPAFLKGLDWVVANGTAEGLNLVLEVQDMKACADDPAACRPKLLAVWTAIAEHLRDAPASVLFEPLNEPNTALDPLWNDRVAELIAAIRRTNPTRNLVVDSADWASLDTLELLRLPASDRHLIASVHYYEPRAFTHQGAPWETGTKGLAGVTWRTAVDRPRVRADLDKVRAWSLAQRRPVFLGEFGAYDSGDTASRARYFDAVAREAEARGLSWAYWQFDHDFVLWDWSKDAFVAPVLHALIPATRGRPLPSAAPR